MIFGFFWEGFWYVFKEWGDGKGIYIARFYYLAALAGKEKKKKSGIIIILSECFFSLYVLF